MPVKPLTALASALLLLSEALDDDHDTDVTAELLALDADAARAVSSYLGLTVVVTTAADAISMTIPPDVGSLTPIRSSIHLQICENNVTQPVTFTLYAAILGAFVDLAADLAFMLGMDLAGITLDQHLNAPNEQTGIAEWKQINQAIGFLIDRGHLPEQAQHQLSRDAASAGITLAAAAALVLDSLTS